jgi:hypothetical protein
MRTTEEIKRETEALNWIGYHPQARKSFKSREVLSLLETALGWLNGAAEAPSSILRGSLSVELKLQKIKHCRGCGCTDNYACAGGCRWSSQNFCSACQ